MNTTQQHHENPESSWDQPFWRPHHTQPPQLEITLDAFEGPLSLLLHLAQEQRIDLTLLSLRDIVDQYLAFIKKTPNLEHCAQHLRMAAYLTWLKSRRLLPNPQEDEEDCLSPEEEELQLLQRLQHLKTIREAANLIMAQPRVGHSVWNRNPSPSSIPQQKHKTPDLTSLLSAYGRVLSRKTNIPLKIIASKLYNTHRLLPLIRNKLFAQKKPQWMPLSQLIPSPQPQEKNLHRRSAISATFLAVLTLLNQGEADAKQSSILAPLYIIAKTTKKSS
jgi:segregation and condensation protein A